MIQLLGLYTKYSIFTKIIQFEITQMKCRLKDKNTLQQILIMSCL